MFKIVLKILLTTAVFLTLLSACQQSAPATPSPPETISNDWIKIEPAGDTRCAHDTPYAYWVRQGSLDNLFIYFQGGGGCYDAATCGTPASYDEAITAADDPQATIGGVFDLDNPDNPFRNHTMLFVPYCTGDVHSGSRVETYTTDSGRTFDIFHHGHINASTALGWVYENVPDPESVFITGCSAGAIGSILHAPHIIEQYPNGRIAQLGDSGGGLTSFIAWDVAGDYDAGDSFPNWIEGMDEIARAFTVSKFTTAVSTHYPTVTFAQYNAANDSTQRRYYVADGGTATVFPNALQSTLTEIEQSTNNFYSFTGAGERHCILKHQALYTEKKENDSFLAWIISLAAGEEITTVR